MPVQATLQGSADVKPASIQRLAGWGRGAGEERVQPTHRRRPRRALGSSARCAMLQVCLLTVESNVVSEWRQHQPLSNLFEPTAVGLV